MHLHPKLLRVPLSLSSFVGAGALMSPAFALAGVGTRAAHARLVSVGAAGTIKNWPVSVYIRPEPGRVDAEE
ncbi:hypothetical protein H4582DRAFT_1983571 [Lactarius indigo]|nr:hypothetical protein H4582DRAFT_1983571 [Lactarius indigo]